MRCRYFVALLMLVCTFGVAAEHPQPGVPAPEPELGISVVGPAVYDYDALRSVLEALVAELSRAGTVLSIDDVKDALYKIQGSQATSVYGSMRLNVAPPVSTGAAAAAVPTAPTTTPQVVQQTKGETGSAGGEGSSGGSSSSDPSSGGSSSGGSSGSDPSSGISSNSGSSSAGDGGAGIPKVPDIKDSEAGSTPHTVDKLGPSALDVLAEQLDVSRQLAVLRLVMEEAHSDRFRFSTEGGCQVAQFRAKTVLGFQISVDAAPPKAVAEVRLTVTAPDPLPENPAPRLSVVRILPEDKTYNVSMQTTDTRDFGLGAAVEFLGFGGLWGRNRSGLWLVRDTDTVALLYPRPEDETGASFGWQFRPVLGRKAVQPGKRDVYVALSLPECGDRDCVLRVKGTVCWRSFNPKTKVVGPRVGAPSEFDLGEVLVPARTTLASNRRPACRWASITPAGTGQALVVLEGNQLDQNTTVLVGGRAIREPDLIRTGDHRLAFRAPVADLAACPVRLGTPYGTVVRLYPQGDDELPSNCEVKSVTVTPCDAANARVEVEVGPCGGNNYWDSAENCYPWAAAVGGKLFALDNLTASASLQEARLAFVCDMNLLRNSAGIHVSRLAIGDQSYDECVTPPEGEWKWDDAPLSISDVCVEAVTEVDGLTHYALAGTGLRRPPGMEIFVAGTATQYVYVSHNLIRFAVPTTIAARAQKVIVSREGGAPATYSMAQAAVPAPAPALTGEPIKVPKGRVGGVAITGENLDLIKEIRFGEKTLTLYRARDGKWWLYLIPDVTATAGAKSLLVKTDSATTEFALTVEDQVPTAGAPATPATPATPGGP